MPEKKTSIQINGQDAEIGVPNFETSGPMQAGSNLFKNRTLMEGLGSGAKSGGASLINGLLEGIPLVARTAGVSGPMQLGAKDYIPAPQVDPLKNFKDFLKDVEASNDYTGKYYQGENLSSLFQKFNETKAPEDFDKFVDYTVNRVAQQIPTQALLWGSAAVGIPAPLALAVMGTSSGGNRYAEDQQTAPQLKESDRVNRAYQTGILEAGTEYLSYGMKGAATAGRSVLEAIPGIGPLMAKTISRASSGMFAKAAKALGATPARRIITETLLNMLGEGFEEVVNEVGQMLSDEHYGVRMYSTKEKLDHMIEAFGISAISSGIIGSPIIAASELQQRREAGDYPTPEELFTAAHIIKTFKNGLPGSMNPENQIHVATGDVILLEVLVNDMIKNQEWKDPQGRGSIELLGGKMLEKINEGVISEPAPTVQSSKAERAEKFKRWFGDSKVVDENGDPLVVYHGTTTGDEFSEFKYGELGFHFGTSEQAQQRIDWDFENRQPEVDEETGELTDVDGYPVKPRIIPVYLSLKNPLDIPSDLGKWDDIEMLKEYLGPQNYEIFTDAELSALNKAEDVKNALIEKGYDGIVYQNSWEGEGESYIAFSPKQIKSIFNSGGYSSRSANMLKEMEASGMSEDLQKSFDFMYTNLGQEGETAYGSKENYKKSLEQLLTGLRGDSSGVQSGTILRQIFKNLKENSFSPSVGLVVKGIRDVAEAVSAYRNPSIEIFQVVFTDKSGKIIAHHAISSNMPNVGFIPKSFVQETIIEKAMALNAAAYYIAHNHPSSRHTPSHEDIQITKSINQRFIEAGGKSKFGGHIVMNGERFSVIDAQGRVEEKTYKSAKTNFDLNSPLVREPENIAAEINSNFKLGKTTVIYMNQALRIMAMEYHREGINLSETISQKLRAYNAPKFAVVQGVQNVADDQGAFFKALRTANLPEGLIDALVVDPTGEFIAATDENAMPTKEGVNPFGKKSFKGMTRNQMSIAPESMIERSIFKIADDEAGYKDQAPEAQKYFTRTELNAAIVELTKEIDAMISDETEALKSLGENFKGGETYTYEKEGGQTGYARTKLPDYLKSPRTGNKPVNQKQWRELAIKNLMNDKGINHTHEEYRQLMRQKRIFVEKFVSIEMESAHIRLAEMQKTPPKKLEEMSKEEREWFEHSAKQLEIFDDVPPEDYKEMDKAFGGMDPISLKDISGVEMHWKDAYRNFEKVFGEHFPKMEEKILHPLDKAVNEFIEFQKRMTSDLRSEIVEKLGIKKKSKLSSLIQLYGEGQIDEKTLTATRPKEEVEKIKAAERWFRNKYDSLLDRVNAVRKEIYPNNPAKLVPRRSNYFRHFREMNEISGIRNLFDTPANIPSELAGTSQFTRPQSKFLSFALERMGLTTEIDAVGGFLNYIPAAAQAIYVDPMIPKLRALEKTMRVISHDTRNINNFIEFLMQYANDLAGKTNLWDRGMQQIFGRKKFRVLDWLTKRTKKNLVLYSASSSIVQLSNLPQAVAKTKYYFPVGVGDYMKSIFTKEGPHKKSLFLNTRYGGDVYDSFNEGIMSKPVELAKWMLSVFDEAATHMTWYALYDQAIGQKIVDPIRYADVNTRKFVAGRALHEVPIGQKSKVFQMIAPFSLEMTNLWWFFGDEKKDKDFVGLALFAVAAWLMNAGYELVIGRRVIFDPINILIDAMKGKKSIPQRVGRIAGGIAASMPGGNILQSLYPEYGWKLAGGYKMPTRSQMFGDNDSTRFGSGVLAVTALKEPWYYVLPPGGGQQIKRTLDAADALGKGTVTAGRKEIPFKQTPVTQVQALAFGKGSIPEVRDHYNKMQQKNDTGAVRAKSYGGKYGKSYGKKGKY